MKLSIAEILEQADVCETTQGKLDILRKNDSAVLRKVLNCAFDTKVKFLLPEGPIEYTPSRLVDLEHMLYVEGRKLYLFLEGGHPTLTDEKRLKLFRVFLENLSPKEAVLMMHVKDKKLPYATITKQLVRHAFPDIFRKEGIRDEGK